MTRTAYIIRGDEILETIPGPGEGRVTGQEFVGWVCGHYDLEDQDRILVDDRNTVEVWGREGSWFRRLEFTDEVMMIESFVYDPFDFTPLMNWTRNMEQHVQERPLGARYPVNPLYIFVNAGYRREMRYGERQQDRRLVGQARQVVSRIFCK